MAALIAAQLLLLPQAHSATCDSAAMIAVELWDEYGKHAKQAGCTVASAATLAASSGGAGDPEKLSKECLENVNQREKLARQMIASWNRLAANNWATIGPRQLPLGATQQGTITGLGTRLYITPAPVHADAIDIAVEKKQFLGRTDVTVCTYAPGDHKAKRWSFTIDGGSANVGKVWLRRIDEVKGQLVSVHLVGKSAKRMRYELSASPATTPSRTDQRDSRSDSKADARPAPARPSASTMDSVTERQGSVVATCQATHAAPRSLRKSVDERMLRPGLPAAIPRGKVSAPQVVANSREAPRNLIAFTSDGGWVAARDTRSFSRNIPDEAFRKLNEYTRSQKAIEAIAFAPSGGWTVVARGAAWTRNVGGGYHDQVQALVRAGKRMRAVAFNPAGWESRHGYVLAYEGGFTAENIPVEMCGKLKDLTRAEGSLDAVAFTPEGGWTIVAGGHTWTRNVGGPSPNYHDVIQQMVSRGGRVHAVAFDPSQYGTRPAWIALTDDGFRGRAVPAEAAEQLQRTLGLNALDAQ